MMKKVNVSSLSEKQLSKLIHKASFSQFIDTLAQGHLHQKHWVCCGLRFDILKNLHKHVSVHHCQEIEEFSDKIKEDLRSHEKEGSHQDIDEEKYKIINNYMPENFTCVCDKKEFIVLLFYHYDDVTEDLYLLVEWQLKLCRELNLKGKIRIATEGINGTIEGCLCSVDEYQVQMRKHEVFCKIKPEDFKQSSGNGESFNALSVSVCQELCTMGISTSELRYSEGGTHLSPEEFHDALTERQKQIKTDSSEEAPLLIDCRNFYESKIGYFDNAIKPDLRKFSYFPEYVDQNLELFEGRKVLTYCTGGIRCERATAYIKKSTKCAQVYQLKGGIHKYLEKYPHGFYKGRLFVFDNRYSIGSNDGEITSKCFYCSKPHNAYQLCSTNACRQLVLICSECRDRQISTCCQACAQNAVTNSKLKQCSCTGGRERAPKENFEKRISVR